MFVASDISNDMLTSFRLEEFLRRRARLQRVEEAVRRNVVVGFFDTLYWSRRLRRFRETKKQGRMATIPQFTVPEIFIEDEDVADGQHNSHTPLGSPRFAPQDLHPPESPGGLDSAENRSRSNSIQHTPTGSPTRTTMVSPFSPPGEGDWRFASALSRPPSPLEPDPGPGDSRSRANSSVSAADVLEVLDNSAWGESIRRSFTHKRRS